MSSLPGSHEQRYIPSAVQAPSSVCISQCGCRHWGRFRSRRESGEAIQHEVICSRVARNLQGFAACYTLMNTTSQQAGFEARKRSLEQDLRSLSGFVLRYPGITGTLKEVGRLTHLEIFSSPFFPPSSLEYRITNFLPSESIYLLHK